MSFQDVRPGQTARRRASPPGPRTSTGYYNGAQVNGGGPSRGEEAGARAGQAQQGGFGSAGALRTGGVRVGRATPAAGNGSLHHGGLVSSSSEQRQHRQHQGAGGSSSGGGQVGDSLMVYSQNVTILHRMVQQLGTSRDTTDLRQQCRCQLDVVNELRQKIQAQLRLQQQQVEGASRQDAARMAAMNAKLTKDFNRVNSIAVDLSSQAAQRMREVDTQRQLQDEADQAKAQAAFGGAGTSHQQGLVQAQQRRERVQMQEEAINTAIIQETEEELQQINKSLYKVNEIYKDLANIVEQQQEAVEQIESNTEGAHARAHEGLVQVQKANDYQSSCVVS